MNAIQSKVVELVLQITSLNADSDNVALVLSDLLQECGGAVELPNKSLVMLMSYKLTEDRKPVQCRFAYVRPGKSIELFGTRDTFGYPFSDPRSGRKPFGLHAYTKRFEIGDECESGSYNLIYTAPVSSITEKSVMLGGPGGNSGLKRKRMTIAEFDRTNWDFDKARIEAHNAEVSKCI